MFLLWCGTLGGFNYAILGKWGYLSCEGSLAVRGVARIWRDRACQFCADWLVRGENIRGVFDAILLCVRCRTMPYIGVKDFAHIVMGERKSVA